MRLQSIIAIVLSVARLASGAAVDHGTVWGVADTVSPAEATWGVFVGLGSMAFAYSFVSPRLPPMTSPACTNHQRETGVKPWLCCGMPSQTSWEAEGLRSGGSSGRNGGAQS